MIRRNRSSSGESNPSFMVSPSLDSLTEEEKTALKLSGDHVKEVCDIVDKMGY